MNLYTKIFRPLLFTLPPESAHLLTEFLLSHFPQSTKIFHNKKTLDSKKTLGRISINNPLGLAAGFDKNCTMLKALENLGFGYLVGGTIVKNPQPGNPKPRIIRKTNQSSLINSLGFPSSGLNKVINNLEKQLPLTVPLFLSISGKTINEFEECFKQLIPYSKAIELNISSPNSPNLENFLHIDKFENLVYKLRTISEHPIFFKIQSYPDHKQKNIFKLIDIAKKYNLDGITAINSIPQKEQALSMGKGGLSGKPLSNIMLKIIKDIRNYVGKNFVINACGGIMNSTIAKNALEEGASTIQAYTGFVYKGPNFANEINRDFVN